MHELINSASSRTAWNRLDTMWRTALRRTSRSCSRPPWNSLLNRAAPLHAPTPHQLQTSTRRIHSPRSPLLRPSSLSTSTSSSPSSTGPPTLGSLYRASSRQELARCVAGLLGIRVEEEEREQEREGGEDTEGSSNDATASSSFHTRSSSAPSPSFSFASSTGPILLPGGMYQVLFAKLTQYPSPALALKVLHHMRATGMQVDSVIETSVLELLANSTRNGGEGGGGGRSMWKECRIEAKKMVEQMKRNHDHPNLSTQACSYINIALRACEHACQPAAALDLFNLFDDTIHPDARSYNLLLCALCSPPSPNPYLPLSLRRFSDLLSFSGAEVGAGTGADQVVEGNTWTRMIVAHAEAGAIKEAIGLMEQQKAHNAHAVGAKGFPSLQSYLSVIMCLVARTEKQDDAAASERTMGRAATLLKEMHFHHGTTPAANLLTSSSATISTSSSVDSPALPFAFFPPPRSPALVQAYLRFHFSPVARSQFARWRRAVWIKREAGGGLSAAEGASTADDLQMLCNNFLEELSTYGRALLAHWVLLEMHQLEQPHLHQQERRRMITPRTLTVAIRSCTGGLGPRAEYLQAEALFSYLSHHHGANSVPDRAWLGVIHAYSSARTGETAHRNEWERAIRMKVIMEERGGMVTEPMVLAIMQACKVACELENFLPPSPPSHVKGKAAALTASSSSASPCTLLLPSDSLASSAFLLHGATRADGINMLHRATGGKVAQRGAQGRATEAAEQASIPAPFTACASLLRTLPPVLLSSPRILLSLLSLSLSSGQYKFALDLFVREWAADEERARRQRSEVEEQARLKREAAQRGDPTGKRTRPALPLDDSVLASHYFRTGLDLHTFNGLLHATSAVGVGNPFWCRELWQTLDTVTAQRAGRRSAFAMPVWEEEAQHAEEPNENESPQELSSSSISSTVRLTRWIENPRLSSGPDFASRWAPVSWLDALMRRQLELGETTRQQSERSRQSLLARASKHVTPSAAFSSSPPSHPSTPSRFVFPLANFSTASLSQVEQLVQEFRAIENDAYERLSRPADQEESNGGGEDGERGMSQSVWQPFSDRTPGSSESVGEAFARHSASAPSPFHLNLHFLSHTSSSPSRTNVDAVLQLSLRKMSEAYIRGGSEALPETGWTIVHGHGRTKQFGSEDDDDGSMHGDSRRGGYQRASHEEWRDARYREPPGADGLPTNSRARQVQSFLQRYFSPSGQGGRSASSTKSSSSCKFHALPGNQGTICVTRRQLILWMDASRGRSKVQ